MARTKRASGRSARGNFGPKLSPSGARDIVRQFVPRKHLTSVFKAIAHSVRVAHQVSPSKWGLRLNQNSIMLKTGFVEVLQLGDGWFHELVEKKSIPQTLSRDRRLSYSNPRYKYAPGCDACNMDIVDVPRKYPALVGAHEFAIRIAARSRRHTSTTKDHSPGLIDFISQELRMELPQPAHADDSAARGVVRHYIAYQNSDEFGPYYRNARERSAGESGFFTAKQFREEALLGQRLWVFEGSGSPKRYRLVSHGIVRRVVPEKRPVWYRKPDRKFGIRVRFKVDSNRQPIDVSDLRWFQKLLQQQQSFRNGFDKITDAHIIQSLERIALDNIDADTQDAITEDFVQPYADARADVRDIRAAVRDKTTMKALIDARLGQGTFRADVGRLWGWQCAVTGCGIPEVLRASHIKPWSKSNNRERLNPQNGLMLAAHIDALFDRGLISFKKDGKMLLSDRIGVEERKKLGLPSPLRQRLTKMQWQFLVHHRQTHKFS